MSDHTTFADQPQTEAPTQSAGELLVRALNNYEKTATELQEFKGCIVLAENDENAALENDALSEAEVVSLVKDAQALKAVYTSRAARAERSIPALTTELEAACVGAERELLERIAQESAKRSEVIRQRVLAVQGRPSASSGLAVSSSNRSPCWCTAASGADDLALLREREFPASSVKEPGRTVRSRARHCHRYPRGSAPVFPAFANGPRDTDDGDYSIAGLEDLFAVERKTVADLVGCCLYAFEMRYDLPIRVRPLTASY
jgi:hypothetical protein